MRVVCQAVSALVALAVLAACASGTGASGTGASGTGASPPAAMTKMSTEVIQGSTTAINGKSVAIKASGVFTDNGTLKLPIGNQRTFTFRFTSGNLVVLNATGPTSGPLHLNNAICAFAQSWSGTFRVLSGISTGSYAGATGHGSYVFNSGGIASKRANGRCDAVSAATPGNVRAVLLRGAVLLNPSARVTGETARPRGRTYPLHTRIVATTFWVGEIFDPHSPNGSQVISTYDAQWLKHYGGCDGIVKHGSCKTQRRVAANGFFPTRMKPLENPFYLDLPFDDVNDAAAFSQRARVIPWAKDPGYAGHARDPAFSYMKNRWVKLMRNGRTCYGQIEDAGPGVYDNYRYVFGKHNRRPASKLYNGAGMDVSPALTGCLGFTELNGDDDRVDWRFVDAVDVPRGPWKRLVTTRGVSE